MSILNKPFDSKFAAMLFGKFFGTEIVGRTEWLRSLTDCHGANKARGETRSRGLCEFMFPCPGMDLVVFYNEVNMHLKLIRGDIKAFSTLEFANPVSVAQIWSRCGSGVPALAARLMVHRHARVRCE